MAVDKMNFGDMKTFVAEFVGYKSTSEKTRVGKYINSNLRILKNDNLLIGFTKQATITTIVGTSLYSLAEDCRDIIAMWQGTTPIKLEQKPYHWIVENYPGLDDTGTPRFYAIREADTSDYIQVFLYPEPKAVITIYYWYYFLQAALSLDADYLDTIPNFEMLQDVILWGAIKDTLLERRMLAEHDRAITKYRELRKQLKLAIESSADKDDRWRWGNFIDTPQDTRWVWNLE